MANKPNYKVLSTVTINGRRFELRKYQNEYTATEVFLGGWVHKVCRNYQSALIQWVRLINS